MPNWPVSVGDGAGTVGIRQCPIAACSGVQPDAIGGGAGAGTGFATGADGQALAAGFDAGFGFATGRLGAFAGI